MMQLDSMRNHLLGVNVIFSIVDISRSVGTFGTNLHSGLESADGWFLGVVILTAGLFLVMTITGIYFKSKGVLGLRPHFSPYAKSQR
ncbi:hypothetical protein KRP22_007427 [Phytophthora ramorum]|nr:hypothetical protein KRP22_4562 [Phytophthora ramorum]